MSISIELSNRIAKWYFDCLVELAHLFPKVKYDKKKLSAFMVYGFQLPPTMTPERTNLFIKTPGQNITNVGGYSFYLDKEAKLLYQPKSNHLYTDGYNDLKDKGLKRVSFHLQSFKPAMPIEKGDTFADICRSLYTFLGEKW